ncbi:patatin-like phospholipase family protein [Candidatus Bipolaricaulota bacterium]|nr:patatin-like phospholipase family protein [Candidatus Bipolaricaulota bacterium]
MALSSGGPRGVAHVGVLQALSEAGVPVYAIAGASVGAQVGGLYAAGVPLSDIARLWGEMGFTRLARGLLPTFPWRGWSSGEEVRRTLYPLVGDVTIEQLPVRYAAVATDLRTGESVAITHGPLVDAIRASVSVPGLFVPAQLGDRLLLDGGVTNPLPVDVARALGAEVVVAVDVLVPPSERPPVRPNVFSVLFQMATIFQKRLSQLEAQVHSPEVLILPDFGNHPPTYSDVGQGVEAGYRAMQAALPHLKELLEE